MSGIDYFASPSALSSASSPITAAFSTVGLSSPFQAPPGTVSVEIDAIGAGAGGSSGRQGAVGSTICGGGAASGGMRSTKIYLLSELAAIVGVPVADLYFEVDIGAGGTGGPAQATLNTNGISGVSGGTTRIRVRNATNTINRTLMQAAGGAVGAGGTNAGSVPGGGVVSGPGTFPGGQGGAGTAGVGSTGGTSNDGPGGGGGGAGHNGALIAKNGGASGGVAAATYGQIVAPTLPGQNASTNIPDRCPGGGGGGAPVNADGTAGVAGEGFRGGGGGGGAGGAGSNPSSAGKKGGNGYGYFIWRKQ